MADVDRCVCCGADIPEGRQFCHVCADGHEAMKYETCLGCPDRVMGCHSKCPGYMYRARLDEARRQRRADEVRGTPGPSRAQIRKKVKDARRKNYG